MEFFHVIPAIIVLVYWIAEASKGTLFNFFPPAAAGSLTQQSLASTSTQNIQSEKTNIVDIKKQICLTAQVKKSLDSSGLSYVIDDEEGFAWVMLSNDHEFCECRDVFINVQTDVNIITYSLGIIDELKDEDIIPITELCNRLNDRITYGRFVFDYSDASVRLVVYFHLMNDAFSSKRHQMYFGALLQYKIDLEPCFLNVKLNKELPIIAAMGK